MAKLGRNVVFAGTGVLTLVAAAAIFVLGYSPAQRPAPDLEVPTDEATIARGKYLATHVMACGTCHGKRDWSVYAAPSRQAFTGGECWGEAEQFPGQVCATNLTPSPDGIGAWTDGELQRAIREGVDREGHALLLMPYTSFAYASDDDTNAVIAYLRSLDSADGTVPESHIDFPVSFFVKLGPQPIEGPVTAPPRGETVEYGEYLSRVALCRECHTPVDDRHLPIGALAFGGGQTFEGTHETVVSANITPSPAGLGSMTKEAFVQRFRDHLGEEVPAPEGRNTVMPWRAYAGMDDADLGALYLYLQTVEPIATEVVTFPENDAS